MKLGMTKGQWRTKRARGVSCGHPDRPYLARNMCKPCYAWWYVSGGREEIRTARLEWDAMLARLKANAAYAAKRESMKKGHT